MSIGSGARCYPLQHEPSRQPPHTHTQRNRTNEHEGRYSEQMSYWPSGSSRCMSMTLGPSGPIVAHMTRTSAIQPPREGQTLAAASVESATRCWAAASEALKRGGINGVNTSAGTCAHNDDALSRGPTVALTRAVGDQCALCPSDADGRRARTARYGVSGGWRRLSRHFGLTRPKPCCDQENHRGNHEECE